MYELSLKLISQRRAFGVQLLGQDADSSDWRHLMTVIPSTASVISLAVMSMGLVAPSHAHQPSSGWTYPPACCKGNDVGGDCDAIPSWDVRKGPRGFSVILQPGDHHLATRSHNFFIPYGDEIPSGDGNYHLCLHPTEDNVNCFFAPPDNVKLKLPLQRRASMRQNDKKVISVRRHRTVP